MVDVQGSKDSAAIIGAGFGGLSLAIRLQAAGIQTVVYEALDKPGGRAYVFEQDGFTFDAGPTVITAPHCIDELFELCGRRREDYVELLPVKPFYRLEWQDGVSFDYDGDAESMRRQIAALNPEDVQGYERFVEHCRKVFVKGYEELAATPFLRFSDMLQVAPDLARLRADRSVYQAVSRFVRDPHLREAFSFHSLLVGGNPFETSSIYTLIHYLERKWGVYFPRGGTGALVQAMVRLFQELGGTLRLNSPVERIRLLESPEGVKHEVALKDGSRQTFGSVASNADVHHTYSKLYQGVSEAKRTSNKLARKNWSMSLFVLYFGTRRLYPDIAHHTVVFGPRYKALLADIFHGSTLPDDFSLYLHSPTVTDPSLAPAGCSSFYVLSPVPHLGHAPIDWQTVAPVYAERILTALEKQLPGVRQEVVTQRWVTPEYFRDTLGAFHGSAFSVAPNLTQSAWFRPHNRDPEIPGLYIVGAGTHPGAGLPGVINSAKATASLMLAEHARSGQRNVGHNLGKLAAV
jgi:phytoene desaturase